MTVHVYCHSVSVIRSLGLAYLGLLAHKVLVGISLPSSGGFGRIQAPVGYWTKASDSS